MNSSAVSAQPLTSAEIEQLAADWYRKLDVHAPLEDVLPLLDDQDLEMVFPEATLQGIEQFTGWYEGVIGIFFDEVHTLRRVEADIVEGGETAIVDVVVGWEASVWKPPAANSERIVLDAFQTWLVRRSPATGKPVITRYTVDRLEYAEGSARL